MQLMNDRNFISRHVNPVTVAAEYANDPELYVKIIQLTGKCRNFMKKLGLIQGKQGIRGQQMDKV